jgi:hypothetical protein
MGGALQKALHRHATPSIAEHRDVAGTANSGNREEAAAFDGKEYARRDLNPQPMVPKTIALSS